MVGEPVIIGRATLYLGDCRDILPTLPKVDAVVTDPPYGIKADRDRNSEQWGWRDYGKGGWDSVRPDPELMELVLAAGKFSLIWGGNYFLEMLPAKPLNKWLIWDKGQEGFSLADAELAWCSWDGAIRRKTYTRGEANQHRREHPTQKSLEVMKWCIGHLPEPNSTILDPFMGSGTTGVAAVQMGIPFIGIERDPEFFEIACRRIREANGDDAGPLFGEAA